MIGHPDKRMALGHPEVIEELREVRAEPVIETGGYSEDEKFAFRMITYHPKEAYCTQGQNLPSLHERQPYNPVWMHPEDLQSLGIQEGDVVEVQNDFGAMEGIAGVSEKVKKGVVAVAPFYGDPGDERDFRKKGSNVQRVIPDDNRYDQITGMPQFTAVPVNVLPVK
jgi:anaerobic selenocysteine-containing dehydrogenase